MPHVEASLCPSAPLPSCRASASQRSAVILRNGAADAKDLLKWKIVRGGLASVADLHDPANGPVALGVCLYDASGNAQPLIASAVLGGGSCNGTPCWKSVAGGYRYKNKSADPAGLTDVKLCASGAGELSLLVKGKGANLSLPALDLTPPVRLQLVVSDGGGATCWESHFPSALKSDAGTFRASGG